MAESLTRCSRCAAATFAMADRGFAKRAGVRWARQQQADVLLRASLTSLPLRRRDGKPLQLLPMLRALEIGACGEWPAQIADDRAHPVEVRVCAYKKTAVQTQAAVKAIESKPARRAAGPAPGSWRQPAT
ncbi:MAG: hypothetical protein U1E95_13015 [Rubrivivax sp.]